MTQHGEGGVGEPGRSSAPPPSGEHTHYHYHDEDTDFKVLHALVRNGFSIDRAKQAISDMTDDGVLFCERKEL